MPLDPWDIVQKLAAPAILWLIGWLYGTARKLKAEREANLLTQRAVVALIQRVRLIGDVSRIALATAEDRIFLPQNKREYIRRKANLVTDDLADIQGAENTRRSSQPAVSPEGDTLELEDADALRSLLRKAGA